MQWLNFVCSRWNFDRAIAFSYVETLAASLLRLAEAFLLLICPQVFTWYGATIDMDGDTETDYTADEVLLCTALSFFLFRPPSFDVFTNAVGK